MKKNLIQKLDLIPVILSGGSGTRLWPLSRGLFPKQYLNLEEKIIILCFKIHFRLRGLNNLRNQVIVSSEEQRFLVAEQMKAINVIPESIILEPISRNTAPAITCSSYYCFTKLFRSYSSDSFIDHNIDDEENFRKLLNQV